MGDMRQIADFLGQAAQENPDELAGKGGGGGFDGPPLNESHEYRVQVAKAEWRQANQSGKWSYAITFEVIEDPSDDNEFLGRKFTEYYSIDKGNRIAQEKFSKFIGQSGVDVSDLDQSDNQKFIDGFVDATFVAAVRTWGQDNDRTGIRWVNRDNGQSLRTDISAQKSRGGSAKPLQADIAVNKQKGPVEEPAEEPESAPPVTLPKAPDTASSGITLPPGLSS